MIAGLNKKTFLVLGIGFIVLFGAALQFADRSVGLALLSGYGLFSVNYILLARIFAGLILISQTGVTTPRMKTGLFFGTGIKFIGLIAALYALIIYWKLSGVYIAVGSLISLLLLTSLLVTSYMKSLRSTSRL